MEKLREQFSLDEEFYEVFSKGEENKNKSCDSAKSQDLWNGLTLRLIPHGVYCEE